MVQTQPDNISANMEFPICKGTYSNEINVSDVVFLLDVVHFFDEEYKPSYLPYIVGHCYYCRNPGGENNILQHCGGCQLVSYCNRKCQRSAWAVHKFVCKEFPVVNGKNVLHSTGSWKKTITDLRERIPNIIDPVGNAARIFRNPRVCHTCRKARADQLYDCKKCRCVTYCSKYCVEADKLHKEYCYSLHIMSYSLSAAFQIMADLPTLMTIPVCKKFRPICRWSDFLPHSFFGDYKMFDAIFELTIDRLTYPMGLLYALQMLPERRLCSEHCHLEDLTSLNIHIINNTPLFDSEPWEFFMHRLPKLKQLKVIYIMQGNEFKQSVYLNLLSKVKLLRCKDCKDKNRVITYSVQQKHYHMYFSSEEYSEPDVVVIFGNSFEMSLNEENIHSEISYRNMTHSPDTVLVLMDTTVELLNQGVRAVNAARPVEQIVLPQDNPLKGYGTDRAEIDSNTVVINDKRYFTILRSK